jgi:hypothetical protein
VGLVVEVDAVDVGVLAGAVASVVQSLVTVVLLTSSSVCMLIRPGRSGELSGSAPRIPPHRPSVRERRQIRPDIAMPTAVLARQIAARRLWAVIPMYAARAAEHRNLLGVVRPLPLRQARGYGRA